LRTSGWRTFSLRDRALGFRPKSLSRSKKVLHPEVRKNRRCARELHESRETEPELRRAPLERIRTRICTRAPTRGRDEHSHTRTRAHARAHAHARARREQTERVRTFGPICTDAGRTEPGRPPGRLRVSRDSALSERNQQCRKRERA
jgi:hypothetical protein